MGCKALWNTIKNLEVGSEVWILSKTKLGEVFPEFDTILAYLTNQIMPLEVPSPAEAMEAYLQGLIDRNIYEMCPEEKREIKSVPGSLPASMKRTRRPASPPSAQTSTKRNSRARSIASTT